MSVEKRGRLPSKWTQFWLGALHWLSCGLCSRDSTDLPTDHEDQSQLLDTQRMQPGFPSLMDLNDDCLLEIIDRLDFEDRLRVRVNRRLKALEPAALPISRTENRFQLDCLVCRVDEGQQLELKLMNSTFDWRGLFSLQAGQQLIIRAMKSCKFFSFDIEMPINMDYLAEVCKALRFLKTQSFTFTPIGEYGSEEKSQNIGTGILSAFRMNELLKNASLNHPHLWATTTQLLALIQAAHESRMTAAFQHMNLECAQEIGQLLMGIDPEILADPPIDISTIRTSIKDKEIYVAMHGGLFKVSSKSAANSQACIYRYRNDEDVCFNLYCARWSAWQDMHRVSFRRDEE